MNVSSIGSFSSLANEMRASKTATHSASSNVLKSAMDDPKKYTQLLEQSIAVNNAQKMASNMGVIVDTKV